MCCVVYVFVRNQWFQFNFFSLSPSFPCIFISLTLPIQNTTHYYYDFFFFDFPNSKTCFIFGLWSKFIHYILWSDLYITCMCLISFCTTTKNDAKNEKETKRLSGVSVLSFSFRDSHSILWCFLFTTTKHLPAFSKIKKI